MNREILKVKKTLEEPTSQEKKWAKLIEKHGVHIRESVIERWVKFPETFDEEEVDSMNKHYNVCKQCSEKRDDVMPLLQKAS